MVGPTWYTFCTPRMALASTAGVADVADHYLVHAQGAQVLGRSLRPDAGSDPLASREQFRDQELALIAVGGSDQNHVVPFASLLVGAVL